MEPTSAFGSPLGALEFQPWPGLWAPEDSVPVKRRKTSVARRSSGGRAPRMSSWGRARTPVVDRRRSPRVKEDVCPTLSPKSWVRGHSQEEDIFKSSPKAARVGRLEAHSTGETARSRAGLLKVDLSTPPKITQTDQDQDQDSALSCEDPSCEWLRETAALLVRLHVHVVTTFLSGWPAATLTPEDLLIEETQQHSSFQDRGLACLASNALQKVFLSVKRAGLMSLLLETVSVHQKTLVGIFFRFCEDSGEVVERLVALLEAGHLTAKDVCAHLSALTEPSGLDWKQALCGISMDYSASTSGMYTDLLGILKDEAPRARLVWSGGHKPDELVKEVLREDAAAREFFSCIGSLADYFQASERHSVLAKHCELRGADLQRLDSWSVELLWRRLPSVLAALAELREDSSRADGFLEGALATALLQPSFPQLLSCFKELFILLKSLSTTLQDGVVDEAVAAMRDVVETLSFESGSPAAPPLLGPRAGSGSSSHSSSCSDPVDPPGCAEARTLLRLAKRALLPRLEGSVLPLCDMASLSGLMLDAEGPADGDPLQKLQDGGGLYLCRKEQKAQLRQELDAVLGMEAVLALRRPRKQEEREARPAVQRLLRTLRGDAYSAAYPALYSLLQQVNSLPLLPPSTGERKLAVLQRALSATSHQPEWDLATLEASLILLCSADAPDLLCHSLDYFAAAKMFCGKLCPLPKRL